MERRPTSAAPFASLRAGVDARGRASLHPGARNIPLHELQRRKDELRADEPLAVICAGGYRSSMAASLLAREGFADLSNVIGGTSAWMAEKLPVKA